MEGPISAYFVGYKGGLVMSLIAFSIVFIIIVALMLIMMGLKHVCAAIDKSKAAQPQATPKTAPAPAAVVAKAPAAQPQAAPAASAAGEDEGELVAVISAAIAAVCGEAARVVSFAPAAAQSTGKTRGFSAWKQLGRIQNTEGLE